MFRVQGDISGFCFRYRYSWTRISLFLKWKRKSVIEKCSKKRHLKYVSYGTEKTGKGTVSVISSDPPCKDGNALFTTVPNTYETFVWSQMCEDTVVFLGLKGLLLWYVEMRKSLLQRNLNLKIISFQIYKHYKHSYTYSDKAFKGTDVNRKCPFLFIWKVK